MKKGKALKRLGALVLTAALSVSALAGCGSTGSTASTASGHKMAYVVSTVDEFLSLLESGIEKAAAARGVDMQIYFSGDDSNKITSCVEMAVNEGCEAVIVNMVNQEDAAGVIEYAGEDTPVVFVNRIPADLSLLGEKAAAVVSDEELAGSLQGEFLAGYFAAEGRTEVSYLLLHGTGGLIHTTYRTQYALEKLTEGGINATEAAVIEAGYSRATANANMAQLLAEGVEFDCIISNNDAMALGAIAAMEDAGLDPSSVPIVGVDCTSDGAQAVRDGKMKMTVFQDADGQADAAVAAALNMLDGKAITDGTDYELSDVNEYLIYVPFEEVTAENVDQYIS